jgi:hypothetical protein
MSRRWGINIVAGITALAATAVLARTRKGSAASAALPLAPLSTIRRRRNKGQVKLVAGPHTDEFWTISAHRGSIYDYRGSSAGRVRMFDSCPGHYDSLCTAAASRYADHIAIRARGLERTRITMYLAVPI